MIAVQARFKRLVNSEACNSNKVVVLPAGADFAVWFKSVSKLCLLGGQCHVEEIVE